MKILIIDNYDSFTYNLAHYVEGVIEESVTVIRNDELVLDSMKEYDRIIISPGPGLPEEANQLMQAIRNIPIETPVFAVCLGMQAYSISTGGKIYNLERIHHGVQVRCKLDKTAHMFNGLGEQILVGLYHSWAVQDVSSSEWKVTARSEEEVIMAMEHRMKPIFCVQFHPESVLTPQGKTMIKNFIAFKA